MTTIPSLTSLINSQPSLADYLNGNSSGSSTSSGSSSDGLLSLLNSGSGADGDTVDISSAAQQILNAINNQTASASTSSTSSTSSTGVSQIKQGAQNLVTSFFTDSGIDTSQLSDSAKQLLDGFQSLISNSDTSARDNTTDSLEQKYNAGTRKVYTLTGSDERLRIAVDYKDGKPSSLTITDISTGGKVESATVTVANGSDGTPASLNVDETLSDYADGIKTDTEVKPTMSISLYDAASSATAS